MRDLRGTWEVNVAITWLRNYDSVGPAPKAV
jgi:hypothetical protein